VLIKTIYRGLKIGQVELVTVDRDLEIRKPDEVLIQGKMCGFCKSDLETILYKNNVSVETFGHEGLGIVVDKGTAVDQFKVGDVVSTFGDGCYGDYYKVNDWQLAKVNESGPNFIVQPLATMLNVAKWINLADSVLINGCGSNALLLAKILKRKGKEFDFAGNHNLEKIKELGGCVPVTDGEYDVVVEISGKQGAYSFLIDFLRNEGLLLAAANPEKPELLNLFKYSWKAVTVIFPSPRNFSFRGDFQTAASLLNEGSIRLNDIFEKGYFRNDTLQLQSAVQDKLSHKVIKGYLYW